MKRGANLPGAGVVEAGGASRIRGTLQPVAESTARRGDGKVERAKGIEPSS